MIALLAALHHRLKTLCLVFSFWAAIPPSMSAVVDRAEFVTELANGNPQRIVLYGTSLTANGAWVSQLQSSVETEYPGLATWVNSGGSGMASNWGVSNLQSKVINENPDVVFIEFSMNDAAETLNVTRAQAIANLTTMRNNILAAHPDCEIILQIMNPADHQPGDTFNVRANLALYQQDYRDFAVANGLRCIDHAPAFAALYDQGTTAYRVYVPDGIHPSATGWANFMTPVLLQALGLPTQGLIIPQTILDNSDAAPAVVIQGEWFASTANLGFHGVNYLHDGNLAKGTKSVVYRPQFAQAGTYPVYCKWPANTNRATNVPVTITHSGGTNVVTVNQRNGGGTWFPIGSFPFAAGSAGSVSIGTTGTNGYVIADGVGFGVGAAGPPEVRLRIDNARAAEPMVVGGVGRKSTITVWIAEPLATNLTVNLTYPTATATSGVDYAALPSSLVIPAGSTCTSVDVVPLADSIEESSETFRVAATTGNGYVLGSPIAAHGFVENTSAALVAESLSGAAVALHGKQAEAFSSQITAAGGSSTWAAASTFLQNGAASGGNGCAYLNLGSFINNAKGSVNGKFQLRATLAATTGSWISLGFSPQNQPSTLRNFTNSGSGVSTTGVATIIYRAQSGVAAPNTNGELDMFGGTSNTNAVDGPDGNTGSRTITITLDLTPAGGYNGTTNFGTVTWVDSVLGNMGSFTYTSARDFGSIMISGANPFAGAINQLSLTQINLVEVVTFASWIGTYGLDAADRDFFDDPDLDGLVNGIEHVLGSDPSAVNVGLKAIVVSATSLTFRHALNADLAENVTYRYEWSADLHHWHASGETNTAGTRVTIAQSVVDANGEVDVAFTITEGPSAKLFARLAPTIQNNPN